MRISDWSSDVCSSDLAPAGTARGDRAGADVRRTAADRPDHPSRGAARVALKEGRLTQRHEGTKLPSVPFVLSLSKHSSSFRRRKGRRSEEHTSELQSLMRISYAVFCLKKKKNNIKR